MFTRILVPLDRSALAECVLPHVSAIANAFSATILLLSVLEAKENDKKLPSIDPLDWQIQKAEAEAYLQKIARQIQETGLRVEAHVLEGKAEERIIEFAEARDINLIILSSHGQSGLSGWNISSVVQKIILRAYTSIMIVRAYQPVIHEERALTYGRLMIPVDGSQRAESILPAASSLASFYDATLLIVHVVRRPEMPRRTPRAPEDLSLAERLTERNLDEASKYLEEIQNRMPVKTQTRLETSERVNVTLHEIAKNEDVDLILLSAHGHSGESKWPYGSVVLSFISYGNTPLLIFQDVPRNQFSNLDAEVAAREFGKREQ
jgi:nucleotide-binding universal stress UspA family protein